MIHTNHAHAASLAMVASRRFVSVALPAPLRAAGYQATGLLPGVTVLGVGIVEIDVCRRPCRRRTARGSEDAASVSYPDAGYADVEKDVFGLSEVRVQKEVLGRIGKEGN